jgi:Ca2+-binding EF-hand superfamily protein
MKRHGQLGVDGDDLMYGLHKVGVKLTPGDAEGLLLAFDKDQDGVLSLSEWLKMLQEAQSAAE